MLKKIILSAAFAALGVCTSHAQCGSAAGCTGSVAAVGGEVGANYFDSATVDDCGCAPTQKYISMFGGWNGLQDFVNPDGNGNDTRSSFKEGYVLGTAFGRQVAPNRRRELEFAYRNNSADEQMLRQAGNTVSAVNIDGRVEAYSFMVNEIYDTNRCILGFTPYLGGGIGAVYLDGDITDGTGNNCGLGETAFAYQAFAGLNRSISNRASLFTEYRFFGATEVDADCTTAGSVATQQSVEYKAESINFGIRIMR